ncbi:CBO0543 family protein [Lysinibacillus sp. SGAir0095]|uniref:CBO0543 family protein n=1 Tax=Lysinibacillus sp. SGAir0095 TaxID=2070463 RepID=UPI0010CCE54B|nr:CBO0543 family protein [Lysinibacillus sp. SGAir0095]QCR32573.1 hypothetical protein C1N55_10500 [Lysinibacillus sp. SGAir0095]
MRIEYWILLAAYAVGIGLLFFIPKYKIRLAVVAFLFKQIITILFGLIVVECGLIEYPVRLFASISRTSFTFEYFFFPVVCAIFNVWYPNERSKPFQWGYYAGVCSILTIPEVILEENTQLIKYIHWDWYVTWITLFLSFYATRRFCLWFFKEGGSPSVKPKL